MTHLSEVFEPHPWMDVSEAPILKVAFPRKMTTEEIVAYLAKYNELFTGPFQGVRYGVVADISHVSESPSQHRKMVADNDHKWSEYDRQFCVATGFVSAGAISRGLLTAFTWLAPPSYPYQVFADVDSATAWVRQRMLEVGISADS